MDCPVLLRQARAGDQRLSFFAAVLAAARTERPGAARWTELTVYRLPRRTGEEPARGGYVVAKVGRSLVAHRSDCIKADRRMIRYGTGEAEPVPPRLPCLECLPHVAPLVDGTLLERDRFTVLQARTPEDLARVLLQGRPGQAPSATLHGIVGDAIAQVRLADPDFDRWWPDHLYLEA